MIKSNNCVDVLIVGQGLAGTALAWRLHQAGRSFLIADAKSDSSASRLAAGLITPVGGKRFTSPHYFESLRAEAEQHYKEVESLLSIRCFHAESAVRLFHSHEELALFKLKSESLRSRGLVTSLDASGFAGLNTGLSGFRMPTAARLEVTLYLDESRRFFEQRDRFVAVRIDPNKVVVTATGVTVPEPAISCKHIVFCGGYSDADNPWLPGDSFNSAKGELLTVSIKGLSTGGPVHAFKRWLVQGNAEGQYSFGATYDHDDATLTATVAARQELEHDLQQLIKRPYQVLAQLAGFRPVGQQRNIIFGQHAKHHRIAWINGMGSKGTLLAPHLARLMTASLASEKAPGLVFDL